MQIQDITYRYEELREAVNANTTNGTNGLTVMLSQGMWAWIQLVGNEVSVPRQVVDGALKPLSIQNIQSASRPALLAIWTDLLLGRLATKEQVI
jgi:hypothetical protein